MQLVRWGEIGHEKPGLIIKNGDRIDLSEFTSDFDGHFFASNGIARLKKWIESREHACDIIEKEVRWGPPIATPSKIICIGLNYSRHAAENNLEVPAEPIIFHKATSAISGPYDKLVLPKGSTQTDWEVELAVVIGQKAQYVSETQAYACIAGYMLMNDYSEREFQIERKGQWTKGKSCDTFAPMGPYLVTTDEVQNPHELDLWLKVNGKIKQSSNTRDMIFKIPRLISYISQFMTLLPGDVISTGTPDGVGLGHKPPIFLKPGDIVEFSVEGLGQAKQMVIENPN